MRLAGRMGGMERIRPIGLLALVGMVVVCGSLRAQSYDFGTEWEARYSRAVVKGTEISVAEELRFKHYSTRFTKSETTVALSQALWRKSLKQHGMRLKLGASYAFIYRYNKNRYYEDQHRLNLNLSFTKKFGDWAVGYRARWQTTFRNERIGDYKYNPQMYLRNRIGVSYSFPDKPWKLSLTEECFQRLNHPSKKIVDEFRTVATVSYQVDRHNTVSMQLKAATEVQVKNPDRFFCLGFAYEFD